MMRKLRTLSKEEEKDRSTLVRELVSTGMKERFLERAIQLYKNGRITLWKAARIAGISLWEMTEVLRERRVEAAYGKRDLEADLAGLK